MKPPHGYFLFLMSAAIQFAGWPFIVYFLLVDIARELDSENIEREVFRVITGPDGNERAVRALTAIGNLTRTTT